MAKITVTREDAERLHSEEWTFNVTQDYTECVYIRLHKWSRASRLSRRHGWKVYALFSADDRRNTNAFPEEIAPEIIAEAMKKFIARINTEPDSVMLHVNQQRAERQARGY